MTDIFVDNKRPIDENIPLSWDRDSNIGVVIPAIESKLISCYFRINKNKPDLAKINGVRATIKYPVKPIITNGFDINLNMKSNGKTPNLKITGETIVTTPEKDNNPRYDARTSTKDFGFEELVSELITGKKFFKLFFIE